MPQLPAVSATLFEAKKAKKLTFEQIGKELGRGEVAVAALFYGQAKASEEDAKKLASLLGLPEGELLHSLYKIPDRGRSVPMPPKEPLIYRLYEVVQNYGYAYKAILNEKFGDGIMSAISFSTKVEKEEDDKGTWVVITLRGKWYVESIMVAWPRTLALTWTTGCHLLASKRYLPRPCIEQYQNYEHKKT